MPVQSPQTKKSSIVHRSESLRSEVSDASQQSKRVSFNRDVHVKRIPRGSAVVDRNGKLVAVLDGGSGGGASSGSSTRHSDTSSPNGRLWINSLLPSTEALPEEELLREAQTILKHVDSVTCRTHTLGSFDTRSLERPRKQILTNGNSSGIGSKNTKAIKSVQKSPSRLSDFFSKTLPSHLKNKYQQSKSTQNLLSTNGNGVSKSSKDLLKHSDVSRQLSNNSSLNGSVLSKSEPNLYNGIHYNSNGNINGGIQRYKKVGKIKKPHGNRVALNSIGETPTNTSSSGHSSSGSGSDNNNSLPKIKVSTSDSPVSSLSGPEEPSSIMANSLAHDYSSNNNHQNRVSSIVKQLSNRRGQESPDRNLNNISYRSPVIEPLLLSSGNTHNNNQPFSYITGTSTSNNNNNTEGGRSPGKNHSISTSPTTTSSTSPTGKTLPKEVIYAQVVCSGKEPGAKRTVHTTVTNGVGTGKTTDSRSSPPRNQKGDLINTPSSNNSNSASPNKIQHFVYENHKEDKGRKSKISNGSSMNNHHSFRTGYHRPSYDEFDFSGAKPRNNVTTVLLNNVDDDETSFSSSRNNSYNYNSYRNHSPSPSPNFRKPEQSFYFGSPSRLTNGNHYTSPSFNYKSPRVHDYPSSREVSPAAKAVSSALLVRDAERKKDSIVSSAKLVSTFGHHHSSHNSNNIDYDYNGKLDNSRGESPNRIINSHSRITNGHNTGSLAKSKYGTSSMEHSNSNHLHHHSDHLSSSKSNKKIKIVGGSKTSTPNASNTSVNKLGLRSKENSPTTTYRDYTKSKSPEKTTTLRRSADNSLERKYNRKNKQEVQQEHTTTTTTSTGGTGLISTLMRRNKDKKIQKEAAKEKERKELAETSSPMEPPGSKENKIKRQRAKFLSAFLDKNFPSKAKTKNTEATNTNTTTINKTTNSVDKKLLMGKNNKPTDSEIEDAERRRDGEYHSWSSGDEDYRFGHNRNGQLTRGKSYNFGEFNEESGTKSWYDQNDSDYRRELATSGNPYTSATLGNRQRMRSSGHDSDNLRSKSLDRRAYKNRTSPPRIMVTPNTPAVEETDKWKSTYDPIIRSFDRDRIDRDRIHNTSHHHPILSKKASSGLSKSSYELDDHHGDRGDRGTSGSNSSKLRYFGDTDAEELNYQNGTNSYLGKNHHSGHHNKFIPRSSSYLSRGSNSKYYTVPGSSFNSSESENGETSRMSKGSSAGSQRSVYLHAPAIADIPPTGMQRRTLSRDELSNHSGSQKQTKHLARSMSVLAPWRPRHNREKYEVNYSNNDGSKENQPYGRPPKPPRSPTRKSMSPSPGRGRAGSTESLLKSSDDKRDKSPQRSSTLGRNKENVKISRSKSMPKDTRLFAGWLRKRRFGKEAKS